MRAKISKDNLLTLLRDEDHFLFVAHERPDGDAAGSALAMMFGLRALGKNADVYFPEELPRLFNGLTPEDLYSNENPPVITNYSYVISLDTATSERIDFGETLSFDSIPIPIINIDHHPDNKMFGQHNYVVHDAASAQIVFNLLKELADNLIDERIATLLMMGFVADTGAFRFSNTSPAVMRDAAELLELKADHQHVINKTFFSKPLNYAQFEADLFTNHLKLDCDGRFAWLYASPDMINKYQIDMKNADGLIEILRQIDDAEIVALITRFKDTFKFSLRSKNLNYSVGEIARELGGGGHEMAAGCRIKTDILHEAEQTLLTLVKETLDS